MPPYKHANMAAMERLCVCVCVKEFACVCTHAYLSKCMNVHSFNFMCHHTHTHTHIHYSMHMSQWVCTLHPHVYSWAGFCPWNDSCVCLSLHLWCRAGECARFPQIATPISSLSVVQAFFVCLPWQQLLWSTWPSLPDSHTHTHTHIISIQFRTRKQVQQSS